MNGAIYKSEFKINLRMYITNNNNLEFNLFNSNIWDRVAGPYHKLNHKNLKNSHLIYPYLHKLNLHVIE
jgi:hypothetical protein